MKERLFLLDRTQKGILTVFLTVTTVVILYVIIAPIVIEMPRDIPYRLIYSPLYMYLLPMMAIGFAGTGIILYVKGTTEYGLGLIKGVIYVYVGGTAALLILLALIQVTIFLFAALFG